MRKYITVGKSVAPKKQAGGVAMSSKSRPRGAEKLESKSSYVALKPNKFNKKNRPEDRLLQN
jgi:hypothetical protein